MSVLSRWTNKLKIRRRLNDVARARYKKAKTAANARIVRLRERQIAEAKKVIARHSPRKSVKSTVAFDGTPVMRGLALMLGDARRNGWKGTLQSADRREGVAERYGKKSQAQLYRMAQAGTGSPANPPGRSTHELRSDGSAYAGPVGRQLEWYQMGMDVSDAARLKQILISLGYSAFRPYPDGRESHHVNLRSSPYTRLKQRGLV